MTRQRVSALSGLQIAHHAFLCSWSARCQLGICIIYFSYYLSGLLDATFNIPLEALHVTVLKGKAHCRLWRAL